MRWGHQGYQDWKRGSRVWLPFLYTLASHSISWPSSFRMVHTGGRRYWHSSFDFQSCFKVLKMHDACILGLWFLVMYHSATNGRWKCSWLMILYNVNVPQCYKKEMLVQTVIRSHRLGLLQGKGHQSCRTLRKRRKSYLSSCGNHPKPQQHLGSGRHIQG